MSEYTQNSVRAAVSTIPLLSSLSSNDRERLANMPVYRSVRSGDAIFLAGDHITKFCIVLSGLFKLTKFSPDGRELILDILGPGEFVGEMALVGGEQTVDVFAIRDSEIIAIPRHELVPLMHRNREFYDAIFEKICVRLHRLYARSAELLQTQLRERAAAAIISLPEQLHGGGNSIELPIIQAFLSSYLGTSREAVNKLLRQWEEEGYIRVSRGKITIVDSAALERMHGDMNE